MSREEQTRQRFFLSIFLSFSVFISFDFVLHHVVAAVVASSAWWSVIHPFMQLIGHWTEVAKFAEYRLRHLVTARTHVPLTELSSCLPF